jgi:hypothetical protein
MILTILTIWLVLLWPHVVGCNKYIYNYFLFKHLGQFYFFYVAKSGDHHP